MGDEDNIVIKQVLQGKQKAYEILVKRYQNYVFTIVQKVISQREEAEEVAQDVFIKAYRTLRSFKGESKFSTWLYTIAYRTAIDYARKKKYPISSIEREDGVLQIADTNSPMPNEKMQQSNLRELLNKQIKNLKPEAASVVTLHYLQEKSVKEIAEITGLSLSNVKVKLFRAREALKNSLTHYLKAELKDIIS